MQYSFYVSTSVDSLLDFPMYRIEIQYEKANNEKILRNLKHTS